MKLSSKDVAKMIDHSLLHPTLGDSELKKGCELALKYDVASCCVKPYHTALAKKLLAGSDVMVCAVIGFPHGNSSSEIKAEEAGQVCRDGAQEVDMVINIARAVEGDWDFVEKDIAAVLAVTKRWKAAIKVIFETDYLNDEQIIKLCQICSRLDCEFVKTSTGYNYVTMPDGQLGYKGAGDYHVLELMRKHSKASVQVKAAGKVRTFEAFIEVREKYGVTRVGTAQTAAIVEEARVKLDGAKPGEKVAEVKGY